MTKEVFAGFFKKAIPVVGGVKKVIDGNHVGRQSMRNDRLKGRNRSGEQKI